VRGLTAETWEKINKDLSSDTGVAAAKMAAGFLAIAKLGSQGDS
jgi:hypothetical protein